MTKIFAIIVTYNAMHKQWIDRCLQSLRKSTVQITPVIVDNCSTDGTREYVPTHYPDTVWIPQKKNIGFGQANNVGLKYAMKNDADYVLLINQDATLHHEALDKMLKVSDGKSLISPLHLNGDGTKIDEMFRWSLYNSKNFMNDDLLIRHTLNNYYETEEICAACWLMPRKLIETIGGFNPLFFHYNEDNNYYHRMVFHGIKTLLVPDTYMFHDRVLYGNIRAYNNKRLYRLMMLHACNINNSIGKIILELMRILIGCYTEYLPKHQYIPGTFFIETLRLISKTFDIVRSRKKEKQTKPTWL